MSADARLAAANRIISEQGRAIAHVHQLALQIMHATAEVHVLKLASQIADTLERAPEYPVVVSRPPVDERAFDRTLAAVSDVMAED